ncbi:MAG: ABC transporter permease [Clostridiales Family XIII bacterium]|jgi:simple sugar transport system permease protein|nr:ABC transporter permease [Clostridiales Family XIII bacterium]
MAIKRDDIPKKRAAVIRISSVLLSLLFAGVVLLFFDLNPFVVFGTIIEGSVGSAARIQQTIVKAVPLTVASLGVLVAFKMKFWNIGGEGQIVMGALAASFVALNFGDVPRPILLPLMAIAAVAGGGVWALIPAAFKAKMGTNEVIFTLMMNYIAIKFVTYLQYGPWRDPASKGFPKIPNFSDNGLLPSLFGIHIGWIFALILVVLVYLFINYTKKGYEIAVVGASIDTAKYAGINIPSVIMIAMFVSGGLCGLVGMIQASAIEKTLVYGISANYGFTAIITTWLARLNAVAVLFVCVAFAMLLQGAAFIQLAMNVPAAVAGVVQGVLLFFVLGSEFFLRYRIRFTGRGSLAAKARGARKNPSADGQRGGEVYETGKIDGESSADERTCGETSADGEEAR